MKKWLSRCDDHAQDQATKAHAQSGGSTQSASYIFYTLRVFTKVQSENKKWSWSVWMHVYFTIHLMNKQDLNILYPYQLHEDHKDCTKILFHQSPTIHGDWTEMEQWLLTIASSMVTTQLINSVVGLGVYRYIWTRVGYVIHGRVPGYPDHGCCQYLNFHLSIKVALWIF